MAMDETPVGQDQQMADAELLGKLRTMGIPKAGQSGFGGATLIGATVVIDRAVFEPWLRRIDPEALVPDAVAVYLETLGRAGATLRPHRSGDLTPEQWANAPEHHDALAAAVTQCGDALSGGDADTAAPQAGPRA